MNKNFFDSIMEFWGRYHSFFFFIALFLAVFLLYRWWTKDRDYYKWGTFWGGTILLALCLLDFSFTNPVLNYYFTHVCKRIDYYQEQLGKMKQHEEDLQVDLETYKEKSQENESNYQTRLFDYYLSNRKQLVSLEDALVKIKQNNNADIFNIMRVKNSVFLFEALKKSGQKQLDKDRELIKELGELIESCEKQSAKGIPLISINPKIQNIIQNFQENVLKSQSDKEKNLNESNNAGNSEQLLVDYDGSDNLLKCIDSVYKDLKAFYDKYDIRDFEPNSILSLIPEIDKDKIQTSNYKDDEITNLNLISDNLEKVRSDIKTLLEEKKYSQAILELRSFLASDELNDKDEKLNAIVNLPRTIKERKELLAACENLRKKITAICTEPFTKQFDAAILPIIENNDSLHKKPMFWHQLINNLQGIKNSIDFMKCSQSASEYQERFDKINGFLRMASGQNNELEEYIKRLESQVKEVSPETWTARQHYNFAVTQLQGENYDEALDEINKALEIESNEQYEEKKKEIEIVKNANEHYKTANELYNSALKADGVNFDFENALNEVEESLKLVPDDELYQILKDEVQQHVDIDNQLYKKALEHEKNENYQEALVLMDKALETFPEDKRYIELKSKLQNELAIKNHYALVEKYKNEENYQQALSEIAEMRKIALENNLVDYQTLCSQLEEEIHSIIEKADIDSRLVELDKYIEQKDFESALTAFDENIRTYPNEQKFKDKKEKFAEDFYISADISKSKKNFDLALDDIKKSRRLFPDNQKYIDFEQELIELKYRAEVEEQVAIIDKLIKQKECRAAYNKIEECIAKHPNEQSFIDKQTELNKTLLEPAKQQYAETRYENAYKLKEEGKFGDAINELDKALLLFPENKHFQELKTTIELEAIKLPPGKEAGEGRILTIKGVDFPLRWCPPTKSTGFASTSFLMGRVLVKGDPVPSQDYEFSAHYVQLTSGFWIMETEITNKQWYAIMQEKTKRTEIKDPLWYLGDKPYDEVVITIEEIKSPLIVDENKRKIPMANEDDLPKTWISWTDCREFCDKLKELGVEASLPTEAQWEYSCKAGSNKLQNDMNELAWTKENSHEKVHPVKQKKPNAWGIYDMHGNVSEWCKDYYSHRYDKAFAVDPSGPANGHYRVVRGGSYKSNSTDCRSTNRFKNEQTQRRDSLGVRFVFGKQAEYRYNGVDPQNDQTSNGNEQSVINSNSDNSGMTGNQNPGGGFGGGRRPVLEEAWRIGRKFIPL